MKSGSGILIECEAAYRRNIDPSELRPLYPPHWRDLSAQVRLERAGVGRRQGCALRTLLRLAGHPLELASEASHVSVGRPRDLVMGEHTRRVLDEQDGVTSHASRVGGQSEAVRVAERFVHR